MGEVVMVKAPLKSHRYDGTKLVGHFFDSVDGGCRKWGCID